MPRTRAVMIAPTKMTAAKKLMERKSRKIRIIRYVDDSTWSLRYRARTGFRARPHGAYNRFANRSNYGGAPDGAHKNARNRTRRLYRAGPTRVELPAVRRYLSAPRPPVSARRRDAGRSPSVQVHRGGGAPGRDRGSDVGNGGNGHQRSQSCGPPVQRPGREQLVRQHYAPVRRPRLRQRLRLAWHGAVLHERPSHLHGQAAGQAPLVDAGIRDARRP